MTSDAPQTDSRFQQWRKKHFKDQVYLFVVSAIMGIAVGVCAFLLKWVIGSLNHLLTLNFHPHGYNLPLLFLPIVGILLTGAFQRYAVKRELSHGVEQVMHDFAVHRLKMPPVLVWAWMAAGTLTLGFGGSAGSEGPIACTGAAIGSNVGRIFGLDKRMLYIIVGCGAGAGIAGIFKSPLGGVFFTLEVLKLEFTTVSVIALFTACIASAMTAYALSNFTVDMSYLQMHQLGANTVVWIILLGVVCGLYSVYYSIVMKRMAQLYEAIKSPWLRNIASGSVLAVLLFFLPAMFGEGYGMIGNILNGRFDEIVRWGGDFHNLSDPWTIIRVVGLVVLFKAFAASASNSGGGVAGDFAPTLFAGCFLGFFYALMLNRLLGLDLPVEAMAYMGMAGVMSGAIRAPFMALFLTAEMTNGFILFLPLLTVAGVSYGVVRLLDGPDYYREPHDLKLW